MPSGAKKRKAAKKKQQEGSSTQINLKSNNHESTIQEERETDDAVKIAKEPELETDERIEITDSSHDHDKSSSSSTSNSSSSSSDDESGEVKKSDDNKEIGDLVSEVVTVPILPVPVSEDAPFMGSTANVIVETTGLMDLATSSDPILGEQIEISPAETTVSNEADQISLPKPTEITADASLASEEITHVSSGTSGSDVKAKEPELTGVPEGSTESEVIISEEAPVRPAHGVAQRTSWLSCCGLFDVATGSSR